MGFDNKIKGLEDLEELRAQLPVGKRSRGATADRRAELEAELSDALFSLWRHCKESKDKLPRRIKASVGRVSKLLHQLKDLRAAKKKS
jgi:hypothetical protein